MICTCRKDTGFLDCFVCVHSVWDACASMGYVCLCAHGHGPEWPTGFHILLALLLILLRQGLSRNWKLLCWREISQDPGKART